MSPHFKALQRFLSRHAGLAFDDGKVYLAESRLLPLAERLGFGDLDALVARLQGGGDPELARATIEAMTTRETFFFRDRVPFELIRKVVLPKLMQARAEKRKLRIWCAACSTGQEPYSLAMVLDEEAKKLAGWNIEIVATDISHAVLDAARRGAYSQFEVQRGLPISSLLRYFRREGENWRLSEHLRARVDFRQHNLINDYGRLGRFDIIFCRNVLIYFDADTRADVLARMGPQLDESGYLVLGASESIVGAVPGLRPLPFQAAMGVRGSVPGANVLEAPQSAWVH